MGGNFVHNDTNPQATIGREDRFWYAIYADDVHATDYHGDIEGTTGINEDIQDALDLKAPLDSPALTGTPTTSDAASGTDDSQIANCRFVANAIASGGGTATRALFSGLMSALPTQSLTGLNTWVNQGSNLVVENTAGLSLYAYLQTSNNPSLSMLVKSIPPTPYDLRAMIAFSTMAFANSPGFVFGWRDSSTGKIHAFYWRSYNGGIGWLFSVSTFSSPTAYVADSASNNIPPGHIFLQLYDNGTTIYFRISRDGYEFKEMFSVAKSSGYLGSSGYNQICFGVTGYGTSVWATMMSYAEA